MGYEHQYWNNSKWLLILTSYVLIVYYIHNEHNYICTPTKDWIANLLIAVHTLTQQRRKAQYLKIPTLHFTQEKVTTDMNVCADRSVAVTADIATWPRNNYSRNRTFFSFTKQ